MTWELLSREQLEASPSREDGISMEEELRLRQTWVRFLQKAGRLLDLPVLTICTSCVFFQRFFTRLSFAKFDAQVISQACIMLAAKAEENPKRVRDVINTTWALQHEGQELQVTQEYWLMKDEVLRYEQMLLRVFAFDVAVPHPHHFLLHFVRDLEGADNLASVAWCILNDSLCSTLALQHRPQPVACAAIYMAGELTGKQVVYGEWWEKYETTRMELEDICHQLFALYELYFDQSALPGGGNGLPHTPSRSPMVAPLTPTMGPPAGPNLGYGNGVGMPQSLSLSQPQSVPLPQPPQSSSSSLHASLNAQFTPI